MCWHSNHADELLKLVSGENSPEDHQDYWTLVCTCVTLPFSILAPQVYALVLEGRFTEARELLKNHSNYKGNTRNVRKRLYLSCVVVCVCVHILCILEDIYISFLCVLLIGIY